MPSVAEQNNVTVKEEYLLGLDNTPFYTKRWFPATGEPDAYVVFVHGFAEHIARYDGYFRQLAAPPHNMHVFAFDKRGHGLTSIKPLDAKSPQVVQWRQDGKDVKLEKGMRGKNGGWAKALPDIAFWVKQEHQRAAGKPLFLYGHSMGGGESLGFVTRDPKAHKDTLDMLNGVIISGPFIKSAAALSQIQVKVGLLAVQLGLGNLNIKTPLDVNMLSHDPEVIERTSKDPLCEPIGSLRTTADMLNGGTFLDSRAAWDAWPASLPLLLYHGAADAICCAKASVRFGDHCTAKDKTTKLLEGLYHEPHNELAPEPAKLADMVSDWIHAHAAPRVVDQAKL